MASPAPTLASLWWIPVGTGSRIVPHTSRWWESYRAVRERRRPLRLYHAALALSIRQDTLLVEMTPVWGQTTSDRGVVAIGPVGSRLLGRWRAFQYEIRAWPDGELAERAATAAPPWVIELDTVAAQTALEGLGSIPLHTWGRRVGASDDMWNSNSVISWFLTRAGIDANRLSPPTGGRAPGWAAGVAEAAGRSSR